MNYMLIDKSTGLQRILCDKEGHPRRFENKPSRETLFAWSKLVRGVFATNPKDSYHYAGEVKFIPVPMEDIYYGPCKSWRV